jgi:hypothetical protein
MLNFKTAALLAAVVLFPRLVPQEPAPAPCQQWEIVGFHYPDLNHQFTDPMAFDAGWEPFAWNGEGDTGVARHCVR